MSVDNALRTMFEGIIDLSRQGASKTTVYVDIDYTQLGLTFFGALGVLFASWLVFEYFAQNSSTRYLYRQRLFHPVCVASTRAKVDTRAPPPVAVRGRSVLLGTFGIPNEELPSLMGAGAHLSYRLMRYCTYFASLAMIYSILVLLPVYVSQYHHDRHFKRDDGLLSMIAITHVSRSNPSHMWVLVISAYIMCFFWAVVIYYEWQVVKRVRLSWEHDSRSVQVQSHYSLMIENRYGEKDVDLRHQLSSLVGKPESEIAVVTSVVEASALNTLLTRRWWYHVIPSLFFVSQSKDECIARLDRQIEEERQRVCQLAQKHQDQFALPPADGDLLSDEEQYAIPNELKPESSISATTIRTTSSIFQTFFSLFKVYRVPTHFVTLKTMASRTILAHMYRAHAASNVSGGDAFARITPAPNPTNLIWDNVTVDRRVIVARKFLVRAVLVLAGFTLAIPIVKIQEYAREYEVCDSDASLIGSPAWWSELISLYLPAIIQVVLSQTIPRILRLISHHYEKFKTFQDVSRFVLHRTIIFQLLILYIIVFGEVWVDVAARTGGGLSFFYDSLVVNFKRLGQDIPPVAHYFASTVILSLITETTLEMLLPAKFFGCLIERVIFQNKNAWMDSGMVQFRYSSSMASYITLLSIMFTFSPISPIVIFFCWVFWGISFVWNRYAFIYLNNRKYEVGASFSPTIYSAISTSLVISQIALFVVAWSSDNDKWHNHIHHQVYALGALVILLLLFKYAVMKNFASHASEFTSLSLSTEIDKNTNPAEVVSSFSTTYYLQPEAKVAATVAHSNHDDSPDDEQTHLLKNV